MSALLNPRRRAESWLPLITTTRAPVSRSRTSACSRERHRVHRRHRAVVDVARDEHGVHSLPARRLHEVIEAPLLRLAQVGLMQRAPEMPVGRVQEPHGTDHSENPPDIRADVAKSRTALATSHHFSSFHQFRSISRPICRVSGAETDGKMAAWRLAVLAGEALWIIRDGSYRVRNFRGHEKPERRRCQWQ